MRPVDEVAVLRLCDGDIDPRSVTPTERAEAVRVLNGRGLNDAQISTRTALAQETVLRIRHRRGIPTAQGWAWSA